MRHGRRVGASYNLNVVLLTQNSFCDSHHLQIVGEFARLTT